MQIKTKLIPMTVYFAGGRGDDDDDDDDDDYDD